MKDLQGRVLLGLRWQAAAKLGSQIISWSVTIFVMRLLGPADYGLMAMATVLVGFTGLIAEMGLGSALVQSEQIDAARQRQVFGLSLLVNSGLYLSLAIAAPLAVAAFNEPRLLLLILVMGLQLPLAALTVVPESMARRELNFKALGIIELVVQTTTVLTTLAAALLGLGVWALVVGQLAQSAIKSLLLLAHFGTVKPTFSLRQQKSLLVFGGSLTLNRMVWYFSSQADVFIAGRLLGSHLLGIYSVATHLANMPMQKIMSISNQVAFSAFARLQDQPAKMSAALLRSLRLISALSLSLLWGLAGVAPELVPAMLGDPWRPAIIPLQLIAAVVPIRIISALLSTALIAAGHVNDDLKNTLTGAVVLIPGFFIGAYLGGVNGLALAWAICFPIFSLLLMFRAASRFKLSVRTLLVQLLYPMMSGLVMLSAIIACRWLLTGAARPVLLFAEISAGAVCYLVTINWLDRPLLQDFKSLFRSKVAASD